MGGVQIKNCTTAPLKIQLCQVGVLYHDLVKPGEYFTSNTSAMYFTIRATVSDKDDTGWTEILLPVVFVVGATIAAMVTAGASIGLFAGVGGAAGAIGPAALVAGGLVSGAAVVTEAGVLAAGGALLTKELAIKLFSEAKKDHCYIKPGFHIAIRAGGMAAARGNGPIAYSFLLLANSTLSMIGPSPLAAAMPPALTAIWKPGFSSMGWYFGGENHLEIHGGPQILASSKGFEYSGTSLSIVDKNNPNRHS